MASTTFFTNETVSLEKKLETYRTITKTPENQIDAKYEIDACTKWVQQNGYQHVCLQFPDFMLCDSGAVAFKLQQQLAQRVYILGDTAYESCCLDYVAAAHVSADAIIHFGPTCFSQRSDEIPSLFIYEKFNLNVVRLTEEICEKFGNDLVDIVLDTPYYHIANELTDAMRCKNAKIHTDIKSGMKLENKTLYIGASDRKLTNFKLIYKPKEIYSYNDGDGIKKFEVDSRVLKKRYYLSEKIKDSKTVGIIIGTLAVKNYIKIINRMKTLLKAQHKKYYMLSVGKPNIAKLANFPEMDIYLLISCPMNEIFDSRDFYKPIVTCYDIETALNPKSSQTDFTYDFESIVSMDLPNESEYKLNKSDVSLLTGKLRYVDTEPEIDTVMNKEIMVRETGTVALSSSGAGYLSGRSWKGLERDLEQNEVCLAEEGRKGIAQGYANEINL